MIRATSSGSFKKTQDYLGKLKSGSIFKDLDYYGRLGVEALASATPIDTGETSKSWVYSVGNKNGHYYISWSNTHREDDVNIAVILQYGHGTGSGAYIEGIDYINPAIQPIFDKIVNDIWRQVTDG